MPGSRIPIVSPNKLVDYDPDIVVVFPWNIAAQVKNHLVNLGVDNCEFVTVLPKIKKL